MLHPLTMKAHDFAEDAISVPFVDRGRSEEGWDCWGLVMKFYKEVVGHEIEDYESRYSSTTDVRTLMRLFSLGVASEKWNQVAEKDVILGDVIILKLKSVPCHAGVVLNVRFKTFLHAETRIGTSVDRWSHQPWRRDGVYDKVEGFYRYAAR